MTDLKICLDRVRALAPLTLSITNQVTINECANALLAIGASPVMSGDPVDAETLGALAAGTVLNIGTINDQKLELALAAGRGARRAGRPVVLDPVGVGATEVRRRAAARIIEEIRPDIIKGNYSEIKALAGPQMGQPAAKGRPGPSCSSGNRLLTPPAGLAGGSQKGVDSIAAGETEAVAAALSLARSQGALVAVTGATDVLTDGRVVLMVAGGSILLTRITGAGCLLSALVGAYAAANPEDRLAAVLAALVHLALAGERAEAGLARAGALGSFRVGLFDQLALVNGQDLMDFKGVSQI